MTSFDLTQKTPQREDKWGNAVSKEQATDNAHVRAQCFIWRRAMQLQDFDLANPRRYGQPVLPIPPRGSELKNNSTSHAAVWWWCIVW